MGMKVVMVVVMVALLVGLASSAPERLSRKQALEKAFEDRSTVEAIIQCFLGNKTCTSEEKKIKERAMATMRNFGVCPDTMCTPEEREEMTRAMTLLQKKHGDLWAQLIASMFGIDITGK
ncbi:uncharacterized protein [Panulirus ornatus]|uniref:uncharacterized protein n=1 Tax=Panulirus ornatus TaxID=150431 RepID=UPI003A86C17E